MNKARSLIASLLVFSSLGLQAQVYTWVDENGKTHYSDKKPPESTGAKVEDFDVGDLKDLNVIDSNASGVNADRLRRDRLRREQEDKTEAEQRNEKAALAWKSKNCSTQTENIRQGKAGGGTRIVGTKEVSRCNQQIPAAFKPFLEGYLDQ